MKSMRSIHSLIRCCMILLLLTSCYSKEERRVLVIHSYEKDYQGYAEFNKLIKKEFAKAHIPVELTFFYLNCEINNEQQEIDKINNFLDSISKWKPEVLLVNDDQYLLVIGNPSSVIEGNTNRILRSQLSQLGTDRTIQQRHRVSRQDRFQKESGNGAQANRQKPYLHHT